MKLLFLPILLLVAVPAAAQVAPPNATIGQMAWLEGRWEGEGIGGMRAIESWLPAFGSTMVGTFVQADEAGGIMFSEHMYLMEEQGSLILRLRHFNPDLTGWEEAGEMEAFPLQALEHCHARFAGLAMRCTEENALSITVAVRQADGSVGELVFKLTRQP